MRRRRRRIKTVENRKDTRTDHTEGKLMTDSLTNQEIPDGKYAACIILYDEKAQAYREAFFAKRSSVIVWMGKQADETTGSN